MSHTRTGIETEPGWGHERIDTDEWENVYVVGDLHGCLGALERLLDRLEFGSDDLAIFVGDLVRKGPESKAVLNYVRESPQFRTVRGNNEQKLLDGDASIPTFGPEELTYVAELPVAISWDENVVVHGGVDPKKPLVQHTADELLTMRATASGSGYDGPFWFDEYDGPRRVFFGHTVLEEPFESEYAIGLDTGCVYGGTLTAYDVRDDRFVSVEADEHQSRPAEKFVATGSV